MDSPDKRAACPYLPIADRLAAKDEAIEQELLKRLVALNHERSALGKLQPFGST